jgi:hypothetical protein
MNTSIYKNLYTNVYKPIGIEITHAGDWQRRVLTDRVGSISRLPYYSLRSLNQQLPETKGKKYDK